MVKGRDDGGKIFSAYRVGDGAHRNNAPQIRRLDERLAADLRQKKAPRTWGATNLYL